MIALVFMFSATTALAISESQINAILNLLYAFDVDQSTVTDVERSLRGLDPVEEENSTGTGIRGVQAQDHIKGSHLADVIIFEYSDLEGPFSASFHSTMNAIVDEYSEPEVAWVYRHMPLDQIHTRARTVAEASECVASLRGEDEFWSFIQDIYIDSSIVFDLGRLENLAVGLGVNRSDYKDCLGDQFYKFRVDDDYNEGISISKNDSQFGIPYSVVMYKGKEATIIRGAQPISSVRQVINGLLD